MKTSTYVLLGGVAVAGYLLWRRRQPKTSLADAEAKRRAAYAEELKSRPRGNVPLSIPIPESGECPSGYKKSWGKCTKFDWAQFAK
jgi:hypothetical protein